VKLIFTADIHYHNFTDFARREKGGLSSRLSATDKTMRRLVSRGRDLGAEALVVCGDIYHSRTKLDSDVVYVVSDFFEWAAKQMRVYIVVGNHDQHINNTRCHSTKSLSGNAVVLEEPGVIQLDGCQLACMPFRETPEEVETAFGKIRSGIDEETPAILAAHLGIDEAVTGPDEYVVKEPISRTHSFFDLFTICVFGHYHKYQPLSDDGSRFYIGSPLQHNFGERGQQKYFALVDTDSWALELLRTNAPKFHQVTAQEMDGVEVNETDYYRIVATNKEELSALTASQLGDNISVNSNFVESASARLDVDLTTDLMEVADKYVDHMKTDRADQRKALGRKLLSDAG